jgi:hypothetical protein
MGFRPRNFCLEAVVGRVEPKVAWFWSPSVEVFIISTQRNANDGRGSEEWVGSVTWITWEF